MILLPLIFPVIVGDIFDETCGQQFTRPGTTSGGTRASVAPWTVSLGSQFSRFNINEFVLISTYNFSVIVIVRSSAAPSSTLLLTLSTLYLAHNTTCPTASPHTHRWR